MRHLRHLSYPSIHYIHIPWYFSQKMHWYILSEKVGVTPLLSLGTFSVLQVLQNIKPLSSSKVKVSWRVRVIANMGRATWNRMKSCIKNWKMMCRLWKWLSTLRIQKTKTPSLCKVVSQTWRRRQGKSFVSTLINWVPFFVFQHPLRWHLWFHLVVCSVHSWRADPPP